MPVTVTNQSNPLGVRLVQDTNAGGTAVDDTTGAPGTLYAVEVDNTNNGAISYFKMANSTDATAGTTAADLCLLCPASSKVNYVFVGGIAFSAGFSHWCVTSASETNTSAPGSAVTVRYVTS